MNKILSVLCVFVIGLGVGTARGGAVEDAEKTVKQAVDAVTVLLRDKALERDVKRDRVMAVIEPVLDFPLMAKLTLGKTYWPTLSADQQNEFETLFVQRLRDTYFDKADALSEETVEFEQSVEVKGKVQVKTSIRSKDEVIEILYKLYERDGEWRVYDLEIEGVSIVSSYRAEYVPILRDGTPEDLLRKMRDRAAKPGTAAGE